MPAEEGERFDLIGSLFQLLEQLLLPAWDDLIAYVPLLLIGLMVLTFAWLAWKWRGAAARNQARVPRPLASGAPPPGAHVGAPSRWPFVVPIGAALLLFGLVLPERDAQGGVALPFNPLLVLLGLAVIVFGVVGWLREAMREWRTVAAGVSHAGAVTVHAPAPGVELPAELPAGVHLPGPSPWPFFAPIALTVMFFGLIFNPALILAGIVLGLIAAGGWLRDAGREYHSTEAVGHAVPRTLDPRQVWPRRLVPLFALVIGLAALVAMAPLAFAWLDGLRPSEPGATEVPVPAVPEISASSAVSFNTTSLVVPAGRPFELVFHNQQEGVPHDVFITDSPARATVYFDGKDVTGPADITYQVPALDEGDYYFLCSIHPNMNGTVQARPEQGPPDATPAGSPAASPTGSPAASPAPAP